MEDQNVSTPSVQAPEPQGGQAPQDFAPMAGNWESALFSKKPDAAQVIAEPQPQAAPPAVVDAPAVEPVAPPDAQAAATPPADPQSAPPQEDEVVVTEADQQMYDSISAELRAQHPNIDPVVLKRMTDDKFMVKRLLALDEKKSKQISQLLKRVTKKEAPQRVITEFERSLQTPRQEAQQPPPQSQAQPMAQPPVAQQVPPQPQIPDHLNWIGPNPEIPAFMSEAQAWAEFSDPDATPAQRELASRKLMQIRDLQTRLTLNSVMPEIDRLAQQQAQAIIQSQLGDILPAIRQTAAQRQAEESHNFAVSELEKAGMENIREIVTPLSAEPLIVDGREYDDTPLNRVLSEFPEITNISVTHDQSGKPYPPQVAERLSRLERYRAAARMWARMTAGTAQRPTVTPQPTGTPTPNPAAVQEAFQAGLAAAGKSEADRARQGLNAGGNATSLGGQAKPANTLYQDWQASGPINLNSLFRKP